MRDKYVKRANKQTQQQKVAPAGLEPATPTSRSTTELRCLYSVTCDLHRQIMVMVKVENSTEERIGPNGDPIGLNLGPIWGFGGVFV